MIIPRFIDKVKAELLADKEVSTQSETNAGRGWRLAATIHYLRKKDWPIESRRDEWGAAHYRLRSGWTPESATLISANYEGHR